MAFFAYRGRDSQGRAVSGQVEATNEQAAGEQLLRRGILPTALRPCRESPGGSCWRAESRWKSW